MCLIEPQALASHQTFSPHATLEPALAALAALLETTSTRTVWVHAQGPGAPGAHGEPRTTMGWPIQQHHAAWQALAQPVHLPGGMLACRADAAIVVTRAARIAPSLEALTHGGLASALALRTLTAALQLGRNIVWTGPQAACEHAMASLAAQRGRPGVWTEPLQVPVPPGFVAVCDAQAVGRWEIDRLVAFAAPPHAALKMLGAQTSAQAWLSAGRLERALMRLELATGEAASEAAVHLLAAVDLVVVVEGDAAPHITQIAELSLVETGYRPALLFTTGHAIAPQALVPMQMPSFVASLASIGAQMLADDLAHAVHPKGSSPAPTSAAPPRATSPAAPPAAKPHPPGRPRPRPIAAQAPASDSQPGWELDRLLAMDPDASESGEAMVRGADEQAHAADAAEAASLAAQFGLGPPPPPRAPPMRPSAFHEVLRHASDEGPANPSPGHLGAPEDDTDQDEGPSHGS